MPKKKKKQSVKKEVKQELDFNLLFSDKTIIDTDGNFESIRKIMENEFPYSKTWNIKTDLTVSSQFGEGNFVLDFNNKKDVIIAAYYGTRDVYYNSDISCLTRWSAFKGWNKPQVIESLVKDDMKFWKYMWEVSLVDSVFFDTKYGKKNITFLEDTTDSEDEDEIE